MIRRSFPKVDRAVRPGAISAALRFDAVRFLKNRDEDIAIHLLLAPPLEMQPVQHAVNDGRGEDAHAGDDDERAEQGIN